MTKDGKKMRNIEEAKNELLKKMRNIRGIFGIENIYDNEEFSYLKVTIYGKVDKKEIIKIPKEINDIKIKFFKLNEDEEIKDMDITDKDKILSEFLEFADKVEKYIYPDLGDSISVAGNLVVHELVYREEVILEHEIELDINDKKNIEGILKMMKDLMEMMPENFDGSIKLKWK